MTHQGRQKVAEASKAPHPLLGIFLFLTMMTSFVGFTGIVKKKILTKEGRSSLFHARGAMSGDYTVQGPQRPFRDPPTTSPPPSPPSFSFPRPSLYISLGHTFMEKLEASTVLQGPLQSSNGHRRHLHHLHLPPLSSSSLSLPHFLSLSLFSSSRVHPFFSMSIRAGPVQHEPY